MVEPSIRTDGTRTAHNRKGKSMGRKQVGREHERALWAYDAMVLHDKSKKPRARRRIDLESRRPAG